MSTTSSQSNLKAAPMQLKVPNCMHFFVDNYEQIELPVLNVQFAKVAASNRLFASLKRHPE